MVKNITFYEVRMVWYQVECRMELVLFWVNKIVKQFDVFG